MYSKLTFLVVIALLGHSAMASYAVQCGSKTNAEQGKVTGTVLSLSSEDDNFKGEPSKKTDGWLMTYSGKEFPPNKASIFAVKDGEHIKALIVTVTIGKDANGITGEKLVIANPYADEPTLEISKTGKGSSAKKTESYKCLSFID